MCQKHLPSRFQASHPSLPLSLNSPAPSPTRLTPSAERRRPGPRWPRPGPGAGAAPWLGTPRTPPARMEAERREFRLFGAWVLFCFCFFAVPFLGGGGHKMAAFLCGLPSNQPNMYPGHTEASCNDGVGLCQECMAGHSGVGAGLFKPDFAIPPKGRSSKHTNMQLRVQTRAPGILNRNLPRMKTSITGPD